MAEKAIRLGGESTAAAITQTVDGLYPEHKFNEADFTLKHNDDEIAVDSNFAAQSFWKDARIRFLRKKSAVLGLVMIMIILLLAAGIYFTCRSKFVQLRLLGESIRVVSEKSDDEHAVSAFEALMVSTASRVGTGNIVGVANAIAIGGYGSVVWMWPTALVGGAPALWESPPAPIH